MLSKLFFTAIAVALTALMLASVAAEPTNNMNMIPDWVSMTGGTAILVAMVSGPFAAVLWIWGKA